MLCVCHSSIACFDCHDLHSCLQAFRSTVALLDIEAFESLFSLVEDLTDVVFLGILVMNV
jgi:hypothetical protein